MRRRKTTVFFLVFGICLIVLAVALNIVWLVNLREVVLVVLGLIFFALLITGMTLNTIFLLREIRRNEQHDAFLNAVTHELKTPIASIKLYLETLKAREMPVEKRKEFYDIMLADNERLLGTVEQVLQASRTRERTRAMNLSEVDLGDLITDAIAMFRARNHLEDADIRYTGPAEPVKVLGDRSELDAVLANLLENALKYSEGEPKISIRLKIARSGKAEIYVRDNGIGLQAADLKRVFKRFYRVPNAAPTAAKGTGLGLSIVRSIVEKHGGRIKAESRGVGKGTTIYIQLPRLTPD